MYFVLNEIQFRRIFNVEAMAKLLSHLLLNNQPCFIFVILRFLTFYVTLYVDVMLYNDTSIINLEFLLAENRGICSIFPFDDVRILPLRLKSPSRASMITTILTSQADRRWVDDNPYLVISGPYKHKHRQIHEIYSKHAPRILSEQGKAGRRQKPLDY